jgi:hypothetical protein
VDVESVVEVGEWIGVDALDSGDALVLSGIADSVRASAALPRIGRANSVELTNWLK